MAICLINVDAKKKTAEVKAAAEPAKAEEAAPAAPAAAPAAPAEEEAPAEDDDDSDNKAEDKEEEKAEQEKKSVAGEAKEAKEAPKKGAEASEDKEDKEEKDDSAASEESAEATDSSSEEAEDSTAEESAPERACNLKFNRVGCYADKSKTDRPLRSFIMSDANIGTTSKKGKLPKGENFNIELPKFACKCANEAITNGNAIFGIQDLAECWTGPDDSKYDKDGASNDCVTYNYAPCDDNSAMCAGKKHANFVYYVDTPEHTKTKEEIAKEYAQYKKKVASHHKKVAAKKKAAKKLKKKSKKAKKE